VIRIYWDKEQDDFLRANYHTMCKSDLEKHLHRNMLSIRARARKIGICGGDNPKRVKRFDKMPYDIVGNVAYIHCQRNGDPMDVIVDSEDVERLVNIGRIGITSRGYPTFSKRDENNIPRRHYLHRIVMNYDGDLMVDHIDGNTLDCRKSNLRIVTHKQNCQNIHVLNKDNTSGYRNVSWCKSKKSWRVLICVDGKRMYRYVKSKEKANEVAKELRRKYMPYATDY
jgi:hypothetical protein